MTDILVTGSGGFIGRALVPQLRDAGHTVAEIVDTAQCDMKNLNSLRRVVEAARPSTIIHLAATRDTGAPGEQLEPGIVDPALNVAEAARGHGCRVVHVGSYKQYGSVGLPFRERDPVAPITRYGHSKHQAETIVRQAAERGECEATLLRLGPVFGPGQSPHSLVARLIEAMGGAGEPLPVGSRPWDPVYIDDAVEAIAGAARSHRAVGRVLNVSGGAVITPADVSQLVGEAFRLRPSTIRDRAPVSPELGWDCHGDIRLAGEILGWRPRTSIRTGVLRTVLFWRQLFARTE